MVFPNSNLPSTAQPWARDVQKRIESVESTVKANEFNNTARDVQLDNNYKRIDATVNGLIVADAAAATALAQANSAIDATNAVVNNIYVSGTQTINGNTIATGTLSASKITTGTLNAANVSVVNLNASNITSGTLTGLTVQTGSSGQRVVMGGTQLSFYDGGGSLGATMSASSSSLLISNGGNGVNVNTTGSHITGGSTGVWCGDYGAGTSVLKLVGASTEATGALYSSGILSTGSYFSCPDTRTRSATGGLAVFVATNGTYHTGSSSRRFKQDILDYTVDYEAFLRMNPVTFRYKSEVEEVGDSAGTTVGFIAEELEDLGLTEYVVLDDEGKPFGINYTNMVVGLKGILAKQDEMIKSLTARIEALETR